MDFHNSLDYAPSGKWRQGSAGLRSLEEAETVPRLGEAVRVFQQAGAADGKRPTTLAWYEYILESLVRDLGDLPLDLLTVGALRSHFAHLRARALRESSIACHVRALRTFCAFLRREGWISENPARSLPVPRLPKLFPYVFSVDEVRAMLNAPRLNRYEGRRNRAMCFVLLDAGLRLAELLGLSEEDADLTAGFLRLVRKGGKRAVVPISEATIAAIREYLPSRPRMGSRTPLFQTLKGQPVNRRCFYDSIRRYGVKAGVRTRSSPHTWRHTMATLWIEGGGDIVSLRELLSHSRLTVTEAYVHMTGARLKQQHSKFSPLMRFAQASEGGA